ncbi:hypothetical protein C8R43DRAFT_991820 [Mycena crocata]|nr:hypothetical protein C8R43DRAFT_991820 [Mycena crocata]
MCRRYSINESGSMSVYIRSIEERHQIPAGHIVGLGLGLGLGGILSKSEMLTLMLIPSIGGGGGEAVNADRSVLSPTSYLPNPTSCISCMYVRVRNSASIMMFWAASHVRSTIFSAGSHVLRLVPRTKLARRQHRGTAWARTDPGIDILDVDV